LSHLGGMRHRGGSIAHRQMGGNMSPPWYVRSEARSMGHVGPIPTASPGRADTHAARVPVGSYVIPAGVVGGGGQGHTAAGLTLMNSMFHAGPFGTGMPKMGHGAGLPRGTRPPKFADGGAAGDDQFQHNGETVPVMLSGGEYVIHPKTVWTIGGGDINL